MRQTTDLQDAPDLTPGLTAWVNEDHPYRSRVGGFDQRHVPGSIG
jgi:hypothetical protein